VGKRMSEDELQKVIAFCGGVFLPVDPEMHARVTPRLDSKLLDPRGPIVTPEEIDQLVPNDREAQLVLKEINARKGAGSAFASVGSFSDEVIAGFSARVKRGSIGLISHGPKGPSTSISAPLPQVEKVTTFSLLYIFLGGLVISAIFVLLR
jgi:flavine halogenase